MSWYQKCKTNLDFTEARDSEWQWHQVGHMQVCTSLQTNNHASTPPLRFLQAGCPSCCPTNSVKAQCICANMTLSIKPEIHNVSQHHQNRSKPRPEVTCTKHLAKIGSVIPGMCLWIDKHTHTDMVITILCHPTRGKVITIYCNLDLQCNISKVQCLLHISHYSHTNK